VQYAVILELPNHQAGRCALRVLVQDVLKGNPEEVDGRRALCAGRDSLPEGPAQHRIPLWQVCLALDLRMRAPSSRPASEQRPRVRTRVNDTSLNRKRPSNQRCPAPAIFHCLKPILCTSQSWDAQMSRSLVVKQEVRSGPALDKRRTGHGGTR
jgi:hypothetical protein